VPGLAIRRAGGGYDPRQHVGHRQELEALRRALRRAGGILAGEDSGAFDLSKALGLKLLIYPYIKKIIKKKNRSSPT
jgi:hypothetical protein